MQARKPTKEPTKVVVMPQYFSREKFFNDDDSKPVCIREVNENLRRVQVGMELTRPLAQLNRNCEFNKKYYKWCKRQEGIEHSTENKILRENKKIKREKLRKEEKETRLRYRILKKKMKMIKKETLKKNGKEMDREKMRK